MTPTRVTPRPPAGPSSPGLGTFRARPPSRAAEESGPTAEEIALIVPAWKEGISRRILVLAPHEDRSARALTLATQLAARTGASLTLVRVLAESIGHAGGADVGPGKHPIRELLLDVETRNVEALAERARAEGIDVSIEVCWGVPWEIVLDRVERDAFDLVVKPASGLNRDGPVFFGSTALHLFRRCPCPVWVVGDDGRLPATILAAVDPTGAAPRRAAAERILDWTERVRGWSDASVHVVSAWNAPGADLLRDSLEPDDLKEYVQSAHQRAQSDLEGLLAARSPAPHEREVHLVQGDTPEALTRFAREHAVDLIVMGTRGREDRVGDLLGETAETIIRHVRSSVLTIPPAVR